jgi:hypothetical protein
MEPTPRDAQELQMLAVDDVGFRNQQRQLGAQPEIRHEMEHRVGVADNVIVRIQIGKRARKISRRAQGPVHIRQPQMPQPVARADIVGNEGDVARHGDGKAFSRAGLNQATLLRFLPAQRKAPSPGLSWYIRARAPHI